jgi:hypothetical protein
MTRWCKYLTLLVQWKYWASAGFLLEYSISKDNGTRPDKPSASAESSGEQIKSLLKWLSWSQHSLPNKNGIINKRMVSNPIERKEYKPGKSWLNRWVANLDTGLVRARKAEQERRNYRLNKRRLYWNGKHLIERKNAQQEGKNAGWTKGENGLNARRFETRTKESVLKKEAPIMMCGN